MTIVDIKSKLTLPVIVAPMFLVSGLSLVKECCRNGILGTFPALNARDSDELDIWLNEISQFLDSNNLKDFPYGVNLVTHKTNPRLQADIQLCTGKTVRCVIN